MGAEESAQGPADPTGVLRTAPRCMHSAGHSGARGRQARLGGAVEAPEGHCTRLGLPRPPSVDTGVVLGLG